MFSKIRLSSISKIVQRVANKRATYPSDASDAHLLASGGKTAALAVLVHRVGDPIDAGVPSDGLVAGVDADDLEVLVHTVLVDPVGVKDAEVTALAADTLLSGSTQRALVLQVVDTLVDGLAVGGTLGDRLLAVTTADTDTVDKVALLGLVTQAAGLVRAGRARCTVDHVELAVLPAAGIGSSE